MARNLLALVFLVALAGAAHAFGLGLGNRFGRMGGPSKPGIITPQPTGDILLVDGTSFILQTDAASLVCRAGGC
jgi:hypothetical protein